MGGLTCKWVGAGECGDERFAEEDFAAEGLSELWRDAASETDVDLAIDEGLGLIGGMDVLEGESYIGLVLAKGADQFGKKRSGGRAAEADG